MSSAERDDATRSAQPFGPSTIRFSIETHIDCHPDALFREGLAQRLEGIEIVQSKNAQVRVTLRSSDDRVSARLVILLEGGETLSRSIVAESCEAATWAIAFITAVALDPAAMEPLAIRELAEGDPNGVAYHQTPTTDHGQRQTDAGVDENLATRRDTRKGRTASPPLSWELRMGASAQIEAGPAPRALFGGGAFIGYVPKKSALWAPSLLMRASYLRRGDTERQQGTARFGLAVLGFDLCVSQGRIRRLSILPCFRFDGGVMMASGHNIAVPRQSIRPWVSVGGGLQSSFDLTKDLFLTLRGDVMKPLIVDEFQFDSRTFYQVAPLSLQGAFGVGFRVP